MVSLIIAVVASFVAGVVVSFLFFRKNPKLAAQANVIAAQVPGVAAGIAKKL